MKGGEIHEYIIDRLDAEFRAKGCRTARQVPARSGRHIGYVDLVAEDDSGRFICVEVEMSAKRVADDIVKTTRLSWCVSHGERNSGRCVLWIVVANRRVKEAVRRKLEQLTDNEGEWILLLTYGQAVSRVRNSISFSFEAMPEEKKFQFTDWTGKRKTATGTTSWRETKRLAQRVQAEHNEIRCGYRPPPDTADRNAQRPFAEVAEEYLRWGESQGGRGGRPWGRGHARMRRSLLAWWQEKLGLSVLADLDLILPDVEEALRELQAKNLSGKTLAGYADSLSAFCRWCANKSRGYLKENPLAGISRFDTTPRTRRRAMTAEEIRRILSVASEYRRLLYEVAFCSGLRANELRNLSVEHLDLGARIRRIGSRPA
jgi:hypothetical protein